MKVLEEAQAGVGKRLVHEQGRADASRQLIVLGQHDVQMERACWHGMLSPAHGLPVRGIGTDRTIKLSAMAATFVRDVCFGRKKDRDFTDNMRRFARTIVRERWAVNGKG